MADEQLFRLSDLAIVAATLAGPVVAVQVQKWLERSREKRNRQLAVFEALMATRASRLSPRHVDALNAIPIVFYGNQKALQVIRQEWNDYLHHLADNKKREANRDAWAGEQIPKLVNLIWEMSKYLGFSFTKQEIENGIYSPEGQALLEDDQRRVIWGFARIFEGKFALPIWVNNLHLPADATTPGVASDQKPIIEQKPETK
ncbi:DUF6680 family protein [Alsobacter sp. R-9]